jgi:hypothetical protein
MVAMPVLNAVARNVAYLIRLAEVIDDISNMSAEVV